MSSPRSANVVNLAWLRDAHASRVLEPTAWAPEPVPGQLNVFAPDFALNAASPWLIGTEVDPHTTPVAAALPPLTHRVDPSATDFARTHEDIMMRLKAGEFQKVVPVVREELGFADEIHAGMFARAFVPGPNQFAYGFQMGNEGLCGVTPELLFAIEDGRLHTMALAGTGRADGPDLLGDAKERAEHDVVIEHVVGEVERWGPVTVGRTVERTFGALKHLFTPIHVELDERPDFLEVVVRLHPTAALGGYPRRAAVEWLMGQEFHRARGRFGAPFGTWDGERARCVVAIRGVGWRGPRVTVAAGCGVVVGSRADREWAELELKRAATYSNLGITI